MLWPDQACPGGAWPDPRAFFFFFFLTFINSGASGFSCSMQDLLFQLEDSLVMAHGLRGSWASVVVAHRFSCSLVHGILFPQPGIEPSSPALSGRFLTTGPLWGSPPHTFWKLTFGHRYMWVEGKMERRDQDTARKASSKERKDRIQDVSTQRQIT